MRKHGLIFISIKTVSGWVSTVQHSSIWSDYSVCWENTANISFTTALRFPLCLCFPYWGIIGFLSLSVDMLAVCRVHCGLPGGTLTSLQPFLVTVAHNWPPASHQKVRSCMCVGARTCGRLRARLSNSGMTHRSMGTEEPWTAMKTFCQLRDAGNCWDSSICKLFHKVKVGDFREGCAISDRGGIVQK